MKLSCPLVTARCVPRKKFPQKPYNKSFIDQACSVKMTGYWPRSFLCLFIDRDGVKVHEHAEKEVGQKLIFIIWQSRIEVNLSVLIGSFLVGISPHYMASSVSGKKHQIALCAGLATRESKMKLPYPFGTIRPVPQEKFPRKPNNNIDHDFSFKMAGDWPRCEFMASTPSRSINTKKKRTWPISSHLDLTLGQ